jgi:hypothetical protein
MHARPRADAMLSSARPAKRASSILSASFHFLARFCQSPPQPAATALIITYPSALPVIPRSVTRNHRRDPTPTPALGHKPPARLPPTPHALLDVYSYSTGRLPL